MKCAVVIPSRGLIFSEVLSEIEKLRKNKNHIFRIFTSWDEPIPNSFNNLTRKALKWGADVIFYVEEDTIPLVDKFDQMVENDISFIDYGVNGYSCSARLETGKILWCGFGCTTVKRQVFDEVAFPWFRTDKALRLNDWKWIENTDKQSYGLHDIWFFNQAREAGFEITEIMGECRHLKLVSLGHPEVNKGIHIIEDKEKIKKYQIISSPNERKTI